MRNQLSTPKKSYSRQAIPIFLVLFLGYVGYSIVLPIFAPLLFDPKYGLFPGVTDQMIRSLILGVLIATYPLGQVIGCPLLGRLSDLYGRRKVLLISLALIIPCYILSGLSLSYAHISLLFISRFLIGLFEGNIVIATAAIADISETHEVKVKNFGWITTISSSGFIVGPLLGGKLIESKITPWFTFSTPFYLSAVIVLLTWICVYFMFQETIKSRPSLTFKPFYEMKKMYSALRYKELKGVFFGNFSLYISFFFFFAFFPVLLVRAHQFNPSMLAEVEAYLSLCICLAPLFYKKISKHFTPKQITAYSGLIFSLSTLLLIFPFSVKLLFLTLIIPSFCIACGFTYSNLMVSDLISREKQGEVLGTNQGMVVLSECISGLLGGFLSGIVLSLPLIFGSLAALLCFLWLSFKVPTQKPLH